jgi:hypothetical protein
VGVKTLTAARVAWSLCAGCIAGICGLVVLKVLNGATDLRSMPVVAAPLAFCVVGALVASRQQRNPVGWQLLAVGVFMTANLAGESYARYALLTAPGSLPGGLYGAWLGWSYAPIVAILAIFLPLYFPTGRLLSPRWRPVLWLGVGVQPIQLVAAEGQHHHDGARAEVGGQEGEQVAGGAVGPLQILHHPQQRRPRRQPLHHPQQQRKQPPLTGLAGARDTSTGGRLATPGQVGQQPAQLLPGGAGDRLQLGRVQVAREAAQRLDDRANGSPSSPSGTQPPSSTRTPCSPVVAASCSTSRVLPTPASPPSSTTSGSPAVVRASSWRSRASSWVRPTNRPAVTW